MGFPLLLTQQNFYFVEFDVFPHTPPLFRRPQIREPSGSFLNLNLLNGSDFI